MANSNLFVCAVLLILGGHQMYVSALLNITEEAFNTGRELQGEVQSLSTYKTIDNINDKINRIFHILTTFKKKFDVVKENAHLLLAESNLKTTTLRKFYSDFYNAYMHVLHVLSKHIKEKILRRSNPNYREEGRVDESNLKILFTIKENNIPTKPFFDELSDVQKLLIQVDQYTNKSILQFLTSEEELSECIYHSWQQILFNLYKRVALGLSGGYVLMQYSYATAKILSDAYDLIDLRSKKQLDDIKASWISNDIISKMAYLEENFYEKNTDTLTAFKKAMSDVPREVRNCDRVDNEDVTYTKLQNVFQKYLINEADLNPDWSCKKDCQSYRQSRIHGCYDGQICANQRKCEGNLWDCGDEVASPMRVCTSNEPNSRYKFIEAESQQYGKGQCINNMYETGTWWYWLYKCSLCTCTCDNRNISGDRYFNLRPVTSDVDSNYVVTSAQFKKENNVIHIQITQGQLLHEGIVNATTVELKPIDNYTVTSPTVVRERDYHVISWNERTVFLDDLEAPKNHVLTGVRFKLQDRCLKLEIRVTPFNFATGKLLPQTSNWYSNDLSVQDRIEVKLNNHNENTVNLNRFEYLRFTTSDLKIDAGQSTIPFIEIEKLETVPAAPLSGVSIFHKSKGIGDVLALKLRTYNFEPHIKLYKL